MLVPIPCGSCTWSISENREEEFCRASLVKGCGKGEAFYDAPVNLGLQPIKLLPLEPFEVKHQCCPNPIEQQVWSKIDFDTGKVIFLDATRKEDMLQVEYPNSFLLLGWYQDRYIISIIQNFDWTHPVQQYETAERNQLPKLLTEAVRLVEKESQSAGAN